MDQASPVIHQVEGSWSRGKMSNSQGQKPTETDRYVVIHVATTCDEHGVYVTKDSAEVIEIGWLLLDAKTCEEVCWYAFAALPRGSLAQS